MRIKNSLLLLFFISLASCQNDIRYHSYRSTSTDGWHKGDTLVFSTNDSIDKGKYQIEIGLRHSEIYKYKNLWIEIKSRQNGDKRIECDSIQLILADNAGNWLGKGVSSIYQRDTLLNKHLVLNHPNRVNITVRNIMRDKKLVGIRDIGIKLIKIPD